MFSEFVTLVKLILVMPATYATSERTVSALRRVKTYLFYNDPEINEPFDDPSHSQGIKATDALDISAVGNDFVSARDGRKIIFGRF